MNQLRQEAEEATALAEELKNKLKVLEQENLVKDQEVTSLSHKNGLLEAELQKLETAVADFKKAADEGMQHGTQNESLSRRLLLLEEEAEEADKTLRETNEKYAAARRRLRAPAAPRAAPPAFFQHVAQCPLTTKGDSFAFALSLARFADRLSFPPPPRIGSGRLTSRPVTSSGECKHWRPNATNGRPSTRRWRRSTRPSTRSWRTSRPRSAPSKAPAAGPAAENDTRRRREEGKTTGGLSCGGLCFCMLSKLCCCTLLFFSTSTNTACRFVPLAMSSQRRHPKGMPQKKKRKRKKKHMHGRCS